MFAIRKEEKDAAWASIREDMDTAYGIARNICHDNSISSDNPNFLGVKLQVAILAVKIFEEIRK